MPDIDRTTITRSLPAGMEIQVDAMKLQDLISVSTGSRFRQNFVRVARANIMAMALPLALAPIMTRLFTPSDYGALGVFVAIVALLASFSTWRFDWVLPNARTRRMSASLFTCGLLTLAAICLLAGVLLALAPQSLLAATPLGNLGGLIFLVPIALAAAGLRQTLSGWFVRQGDLTAVSKATIYQSAGNSAAGLLAGVKNLGAVGLVGAAVASSWLGIATMLRQAGSPLFAGLKQVTLRSMHVAILKHGSNATWSTLVAIVNALSLSAPLLVLAHYYTPTEIGWYALMHRLVTAPAGVLTSALGQSFWAQAAELARTSRVHDLSGLYWRTTERLLLACVPVAIICLLGPLYVGKIFGEAKWSGAGYVLLAMTPQFLGTILFSPTNHLVVFNKQHVQLLADGVRLGLIVASIACASYFGWGFLAAVALSSLSYFVGHIILFAVHLKVHKDHG